MNAWVFECNDLGVFKYIYHLKYNIWYISDLSLPGKCEYSTAVIANKDVQIIGGQNQDFKMLKTFYSINIHHLVSHDKKKLIQSNIIC